VTVSFIILLHSEHRTVTTQSIPCRVGVKDFDSKSEKVETSKKTSVVTQLLGSVTDLTELKRF
jgi:hypothetical protein